MFMTVIAMLGRVTSIRGQLRVITEWRVEDHAESHSESAYDQQSNEE